MTVPAPQPPQLSYKENDRCPGRGIGWITGTEQTMWLAQKCFYDAFPSYELMAVGHPSRGEANFPLKYFQMNNRNICKIYAKTTFGASLTRPSSFLVLYPVIMG